MATLVLQAAGAFLGGMLGPVGSAIGSAAGALAGYLIDRALLSTARGACRGAAAERRATLHGRGRRVAAARLRHDAGRRQLIWATRFEEARTTRRQGGKGGGGSKSTEYSYFANVAFALCEGEIAGRAADLGRRARDRPRHGRAQACTRAAKEQLADPLIAAKQGDGNTPAYRGTAYVVVERFALGRLRQPHPAVPVRGAAAGRHRGDGASRRWR